MGSFVSAARSGSSLPAIAERYHAAPHARLLHLDDGLFKSFFGT
jgi:hypothetical protein